jgi:hypothetical protein
MSNAKEDGRAVKRRRLLADEEAAERQDKVEYLILVVGDGRISQGDAEQALTWQVET